MTLTKFSFLILFLFFSSSAICQRMEKPIDLHSGDTIMIYIGLLNHAVVNSPFPIEIQDHNDPRIRISKKVHNAWEIQCYSKGFFNLVLLHKNEARKIVLKSIVVEDKQL